MRLVWLATLSVEGDTRWTRYEKFPELSVEGFHANVTLFSVVAVTCRFVGVVGGVRSRAAKAGEVPKSDTSTARIAAATLAVRQKGTFLIMLYLQSPLRSFTTAARLFKKLYVLNASLDWLNSIPKRGMIRLSGRGELLDLKGLRT